MSERPARSRGPVRRLFLDTEPLRRDRDFRWLWAGQAVEAGAEAGGEG